MEGDAKKETIKDKIGNIIGWVIGGAFGYYTGFSFIIPAVLGFLSGWVAYKFIKSPPSKNIIPAFAVQMGQALGMLLAIIMGYPAIVLEPLLFMVVLIWMLFYPHLFPIILLAIYQIISFIDNITKIFLYSFGTPEHKALLVSIIFRTISIFLMFWGLREIRKQKLVKNIINE